MHWKLGGELYIKVSSKLIDRMQKRYLLLEIII